MPVAACFTRCKHCYEPRCRWGHCLAEGAPGRGRGSRSLLHSLHAGALLHDASYMCPLQLSGAPDAVSRVLDSLWWANTADNRADEAKMCGVYHRH